MTQFTLIELKQIQTLSNDLWTNAVRCKELAQEDNSSDYNESYENVLNISIHLAIQTLYNKTIDTHQGA